MIRKLVEGLLPSRWPPGERAFGRGTGGGEMEVVVECRYCGTTLDPNAVECPYCGPTETVRFEF